MTDIVLCPRCGGGRRVYSAILGRAVSCPSCHGTGRVTREDQVRLLGTEGESEVQMTAEARDRAIAVDAERRRAARRARRREVLWAWIGLLFVVGTTAAVVALIVSTVRGCHASPRVEARP